MIKKKLCKLITTGLIVTMLIGSVGTTVSAAEADAASTDLIMLEEDEENGEDKPRLQEAGERAAEEESEDVSAKIPEAGSEQEAESSSEKEADIEKTEKAEGTTPVERTEEASLEGTEDPSLENPEELSGEKAQNPAAEDAEGAAEDETQPEPAEEAEKDAYTALAVSETLSDDEAAAQQEGEESGIYRVTGLELDQTSITADEKTTAKLTVTVRVKAANIENITDRASASLSYGSSNEKIAKVTAVSPAVIERDSTEAPVSEQEQSAAEGTPTEASAAPVQYIIRQTVTVSALKEGTADLTVKAEGQEPKCCKINVNPVPVALGKSSNLRWKNTTVLYWDAVKNASTYRVIVYLTNNGKSYTKTVNVKGTHYDIEDDIISLIRANKANLKGAAYKIRAAIRALPSDTRHYKAGAGAVSYSFRYLYTTYQEVVSRNGWFYKVGKWYLYEKGVKQTGWVTFLRKRYYLDADGALKTNCWIGTRYVKSNGEMARDEWVDDYQYYVDANGIRQDKVTFKTTNWVKNAKGWRYKTANGYVKGQWKKINHRLYYFDKSGYMTTGWLKDGGKMYYLKPAGDITTGRGVMQTGWVKRGSYYYWFDDDGSLASNKWVDRGQYYVNSAGRRLSHMNYMELRNVNTSNRLGYYVYSKTGEPEQSIAGFEKSYQQGNRILVVNLRFTKDDVPVCFHDDQVSYARRKDGSNPGKKPVISASTLKQLQEYDYGIKWGKEYKGTGPLTLEEMIKWISKHADTDVYIEVKVDKMSTAQINKTAAILKKYKVTDRTSMIFDVKTASDTRAQRVHKKLPTMRIGITTGSIGTLAIEKAKKCKSSQNEVFLYCWKTTKLSAANVNKLKALDLQYECGTFEKAGDLDDILSYYTKGTAYAYNTGVETAGDVFHKLLRAATFHEKAHWETTAAGKKYKLIDGTYVCSKWLTISDKTYRFDKNGIMLTGWLTLNGKRYYLNSKGERVTGKRTIDGHIYLFDADGVVQKKLS